MMLIMARGVGQGKRVAIFTVLGMVFVAGATQVGLLVLGVASLLQTHPSSLVVLRLLGAAYLAFLGIKMLISASVPRPKAVEQVAARSAWQPVKEGALNSLTNPRTLLFMFAFLPQFVDPTAGPVWLQLLVLGSIQKLTGIVSLGAVAMATGAVGQWLNRWPHLVVWQERFTGLVMLCLGVRLLFAGQGSAATVSR